MAEQASSSYPLFEQYVPAIKALPSNMTFEKSVLVSSSFRLREDGPLAVYYAPFDYINVQAQIVLVGITPGLSQMRAALKVAQYGLACGWSEEEILKHVKSKARFAGMRDNLSQMFMVLPIIRPKSWTGPYVKEAKEAAALKGGRVTYGNRANGSSRGECAASAA